MLGNRLVDGSISGATYLGVTKNLKGMEIATEIALEIRAKTKQVTGLNLSGSPNRRRRPLERAVR
ncbi:hypothetical protein ACU8OP_25955 (plasmid) [Rhizobium leguminosarum]